MPIAVSFIPLRQNSPHSTDDVAVAPINRDRRIKPLVPIVPVLPDGIVEMLRRRRYIPTRSHRSPERGYQYFIALYSKGLFADGRQDRVVAG